jgi:diguanylate cyclase (GGDEF)-like protein
VMKSLVKRFRSSVSAKIGLAVAVPIPPAALLYGSHAAFGAAVLGLTFYFLFSFLIAKRLKAVSAVAARFASGDLSARLDAYGTDEIGSLATSFNILGEEITNWRTNLEAIAADRVKELTALYGVVETISQSLELDIVLARVLDRVLDYFGTRSGAIVLVDQKEQTLRLMGHRGLSEESLNQIVEDGQGCIGDVILMKSALRVAGDAKEVGAVPGLGQDNIYSALVVPVTVRGGVLGALGVYSGENGRFTEEDEAFLVTIGSQTGVAVENARLYTQTLELARIDGLTGIANRRHLMDRLKQEVDRAERYEASLSVIILDLDKFKSFNDTYGHPLGDELLRAFSTMVQKKIRSSDVAGRYGGEEFCIVLPNTSLKGGVILAERIRRHAEGLTIPVGEGQPPAGRTVSIGVAEFSPGDSVEKLLSLADAALYRAKEKGRNRVEVP